MQRRWSKSPTPPSVVVGSRHPIGHVFSSAAEPLPSGSSSCLGQIIQRHPVISDRHGAYTWLDLTQRQVCWAHLKRDFTQIAERTGVSGELGQALLEQEKQLFELWYQVRDGTLNRSQFRLAVAPIRASVKALLTEATNYPVAAKEKTPWAKTVRTCQNLLNKRTCSLVVCDCGGR